MLSTELMLRLIDEKRERLQQELSELDEARRDLLDDKGASQPPAKRVFVAHGQKPATNGNGNRGTNQEQLIDFLKRKGPSTRKEILDGTSIPEGSFSYTADQADQLITRRDDGKFELNR